MLSSSCLNEFKQSWLPNMTDAGVDRLIDLLEKNSPMLIHGSFTRTMPQGCLATHIAWNHPATARHNHDAGVLWLTNVVGMNPAASRVIHAWDASAPSDYEIRAQLLQELKEHRLQRQEQLQVAEQYDLQLMEV